MAMEQFAREDVREVLARFGVTAGRRATTTDSTEEVILLTQPDIDRIDVNALTVALMDVLPHTKVWVTADGRRWTSEEI
jgi:hypothetical protein